MTQQKQLCGSQSPIRVANIGADKIMFCITARGRFSKTDFSGHHISRLVIRKQLHQRKWFSPLGLPQVLLCAGRRVPFKNTLAHQQRMEKKADPLPPSKCNADLKRGTVLWSLSHSQQAHPEIFILLSNTLSPRRRGNGKNLNRTRHFVEVSQSLKESLSSVSYMPWFFMETED